MSSDSLSSKGVPIVDWHPDIHNLFLTMNGNLTCAKFGPLLDQLVVNGLLHQPDFPLEDSSREVHAQAHAQPALMTDKSFHEMEGLAKVELETFTNIKV
jgi:hypothetical protein